MTHIDPPRLARDLAARLPLADLHALIHAATRGADSLRDLRARSGSFAMRRACTDALASIDSGSGEFFAGALAGAAAALHDPAPGPDLDVVWTGPHSAITTSRLTFAVVSSLLAEAEQEIILVSFATYPEQTITDALAAAHDRGVNITLLLERTADNPKYSGHAVPFPHLDAQRLSWPAAQREPGAALHAKVLVIDSATALVGSANITQHAMEVNLECGILIRGGPHPAAIRSHIYSLWEQGILLRLP